MAFPATKKVWLNGSFVPWDKANVHFLSHALHYGSAVFEGIRCYETASGPAIFRLDDHVERLFDSWKIFGGKIPFSRKQLRDAIMEVVRVNGLKECYIRPLVFLGYGKMGISPIGCPVHVGIATWPWETYLGEEGVEKGVRCKVSSFVRGNVDAVMNEAKLAGNYVNSILAKQEAVHAGYDEAVMLSADGFVAECSAENIFIYKDNELLTPPDSLVLEGITRQSIEEMARDDGLLVKEELFTRDQLYIADEAFLTGTAAEVTPIREVDDRKIGAGKPGPITKKLQQTFFDVVRGKNPRYRKWLTPVP